MANLFSSETPPPLERGTPRFPPTPAPEAPASSWILSRLDLFLSERLRRAEPADLIRHRILVGAACFFLLVNGLFLLRAVQLTFFPREIALASVGYLGTLVLARRSPSSTAPAMLLLMSLTLGLVGSIFASRSAIAAEHAMNMLLPILAVYLVGPRLGLFITLLLVVVLGFVHPYYREGLGLEPLVLSVPQLWFGHVFACIGFLGAWTLGALHTTARNAAQSTLERTLSRFRDSEDRLHSVLESTDDVVLSTDTEMHLLTANAAARKLYHRRTGTVLELGMRLFLDTIPERRRFWEDRLVRVRQGQRLHFEETFVDQDGSLVMDFRVHPIFNETGRVVGMTMFGHDITSRRDAEARLAQMHRTLVDVSRQAGMAEVATGVLHNVGNTVNSVNISASLVIDKLRNSRMRRLSRVSGLLREHLSDIPSFFARDPRGQQLPTYLIALFEQLQGEREAMIQEMHALGESVEHINSIVSMQQRHARAAGAVERVSVPQLIDEALRLHAISLDRLHIQVEREFEDVPPLFVDRHKLLQILINLMSNARHALVASARQDKHLRIRVRNVPEEHQVSIEVTDNGVGIAPEHVGRLFSQGFTTKKKGHGFGLHISALAAAELKGRLSCSSAGLEQGATFTLRLPSGDEAPMAPEPLDA
ncbi:MAG: ATP-binding protein [Cystobacter sp.]